MTVSLSAGQHDRSAPHFAETPQLVSSQELQAAIRKSGSADPAQQDEWKRLGRFTGTTSLERKRLRIEQLKKLGIDAPANIVSDCTDLAKCRIFALASVMTPFAKDPDLEAVIAEADATLTRVLGPIRHDKCGGAVANDVREYHRSLECRYKRDQALRQMVIARPAADTERAKAANSILLLDLMMWSDIDNTAWLERNLEKFGWPELDKSPPEASEAAWIIVQHSDRNQPFQLTMLRRLDQLQARGKVKRKHYASLYDRVWGELAGKQRYGTQWICKDGKMVMQELEDEKALPSLRQSVGLGPSAPPKFNACSIQ